MGFRKACFTLLTRFLAGCNSTDSIYDACLNHGLIKKLNCGYIADSVTAEYTMYDLF